MSTRGSSSTLKEFSAARGQKATSTAAYAEKKSGKASWSLIVEYREPASKDEARIFGRTQIEPNGCIAHVFINNKKRRAGEALNTFFHEMAHVYNWMIGTTRWTEQKDELNAHLVGDMVEALFKSCYRG